MGEFPACVEDGRWAIRALPFPDADKKPGDPVGDKNKESPPTKKSHSDSCLKNHLINIFWFGLLRVLYTFFLDETIFTIC